MTTTEPSTADTSTPLIHGPHVSLLLNPETIDSWGVRMSEVRNDYDGQRVVTVGAQGVHMQSYECDPLAVAAAFSRLSERIANAALDARQSAETTP